MMIQTCATYAIKRVPSTVAVGVNNPTCLHYDEHNVGVTATLTTSACMASREALMC
jgi:hypothetical protein